MSASPVLSVPCLPSCVSLSGGVLWHTALSGAGNGNGSGSGNDIGRGIVGSGRW